MITTDHSVSLFFREGGSDKVYKATIVPEGGGYVVNFAYGRRGNALTTGTKTQSPVDLVSAEKIFDKLIKEKVSKGYQPDGSAGVINVVQDKIQTNNVPQLLNAVGEDELVEYIDDDSWLAQEKYDGRRVMIEKVREKITFTNRKGQVVATPAEFETLSQLTNDFLIDGELVGDYFVAFDMLKFNKLDLRSTAAENRIKFLRHVTHRSVVKALTATNRPGKQALFDDLTLRKKEGIVFKRKDAPYVPGRPASGGSQVKFKFYATASFIVTKVNAKRSVELGLFNAYQSIIPAGNCTVSVNYPVPVQGDVVEVKYLYAFKESGSVYQPSYLGKRDDIGPEECVDTQLKYKSSDE